MFTKLRGELAFCVYDTMFKRAFTAWDTSEAVSLVCGRTDDGFNFVASGEYRPPGAVKVSEIGPGRYLQLGSPAEVLQP